MRRLVSGITLVLILTGMLTLAFKIQLVKSEPARTVVPDYYPTIQEAINHANDGDTIYVKAGIYYENVVVNKAVLLIGENKVTTTIEGSGSGNVVSVPVNNVTITGFTIRGSGMAYAGIELRLVENCDIYENYVMNNFEGFDIWDSSNNSIHENDITAGPFGGGFYLWNSSNNRVYKNNIQVRLGCNFDFRYSSNNSIYANNITSGLNGFDMGHSSNNNIYENNIVNNNYGILLDDCSINTICANNIISNEKCGLQIEWGSSYNRIYHNCFANNTNQVRIMFQGSAPANLWDDGYPSGGNYWSNYSGVDNFSGPYQNQTGCDGIGDVPHEIDENSMDRYPLMKALEWLVLGDVNYDFKVDMSDVSLTVDAFLSYPGHTHWNPKADVNNDNSVDMLDVSTVIDHFMQS
jgi:nitrous oxidase accessory protein